MPTATRISEFSLSNWGPLSTTFTANAACATSGITAIATKSADDVLLLGLYPECAVLTLGSCFPSGTKLDAWVSSVYNEAGQSIIVYFSPGLVCPLGWKTVGVAALVSDGSVRTSGIYEPPAFKENFGVGPFFNPFVNVVTAGIEAGETAALCCPSSMTANIDGGCVSTLPDYKLSTAYDRLISRGDIVTVTAPITIFGTRTTAKLLTFVGSGGIATTGTTSLTGSQTTSMVGVSFMPMVLLVHRAEDTGLASGDTGGPGGGDDGGKDPSKPKAADSGRAQAAKTGVWWGLLACICAAVMESMLFLAV